MELKLYIDNKWQDYSNNIVNEINEDERIDEVFDSGTLTIQTREIKRNIAPNTLCLLDGVYYLAKSTCNLIIPSDGIYNHDITLIESTYALLQTLINEKALSNRGAYKTLASKTQILIELANQHNDLLYGVGILNFTIDNSNLPTLEREFTFGRGTSLFHALLEIGKSVNCIPYVHNVDVNSTARTYHISWLNLEANASTAYVIPETYLLKFEMEQDQEQYTRLLETAIDNVVDRDTINRVNNLTVTSNDAIVNADNAILKLPNKVEEITKFEINLKQSDSIETSIRIDFYRRFTDDELSILIDKSDTLTNWQYNSIISADVNAAVAEYERVYNLDLPYNAVFYFIIETTESNIDYYSLIAYDENVDITIDITSSILETNQWELLEAYNKPKYAVYTSGSNTIENLYQHYNNTFWHQILGTDVAPFISHALSKIVEVNGIYNGSSFRVQVTPASQGISTENEKPLNYSFNIEYKAIVTTYIKSTNYIGTFNEYELSSSSRSFEASASYADFNLIQQSINKTNEMLGKPEITIEIQANEALLESLELGKRVKIASETHSDLEYLLRDYPYYIISIQKRSIITGATANTSIYLNLVNSFSKVAEVIGVASQYESTKNALTGIIERVVYCGEYNTADYGNENDKPTGILIKRDGGEAIYVRGSINEFDYDKYLTVRALDQYAIVSGMRENSALTSGNFENYQYAYGNEHNEAVAYTIQLVKELTLTQEQAKDYPSQVAQNRRYNSLSEEFTITTYKDSRESLIFVIKYDYNYTGD